MEGVLLVDKPVGWTSFDVVNYIRGIVARMEGKRPKSVKVGHTGTLDPFATGLLVVLIGKAYTKRASELSKLDKTYSFSFVLGKTSSTGDPEGEIREVSKLIPSTNDLNKVVTKFVGPINQIPPAYSAIKIDGHRAYNLARAGQKVVIEPRPVVIKSLAITDYSYPVVTAITSVSSGTYIRVMSEDIGSALGTGAYTIALKRLAVGPYDDSQIVAVKDLSQDNIGGYLLKN
ncbi:MAG: hypothetical protein NVS1B10_03330 [Candidatus Saccharimonadales bacterium]